MSNYYDISEVVNQFFRNSAIGLKYDKYDVEDVADLIVRNFGIREFSKILGFGSFGVAAVPVDPSGTASGKMTIVGSPPKEYVFKITCDIEELHAASNLVGQEHRHVVQFYGSYRLSDYTVPHRKTMELFMTTWGDDPSEEVYRLPIGVILCEKVRYVGANVNQNYQIRYGMIVVRTKDKHAVWPGNLIAVSRTTARQRLKRAQEELIGILRLDSENEKHDMQYRILAEDVSEGLMELKDSKVYAVDVHLNNIGYLDPRGLDYKIFDVGVSSSPRRKRPVVLTNPSEDPSVPVLADPYDRWPIVAISPQVNPLQVLE